MEKINTDKIKKDINLVDYISQYTDLIKVNGTSYKARCPFPGHKDKTPSFYIDEDKQLWNCFGGCGGGDLISFVELIEGVNFKQAIELLIGEGNIDYEEIITKNYTITEEFTAEKLKEAINLYNSEYIINEGILEKYNKYTPKYMIEEGFDTKTIEHFEVGFCADPNDELYNRVTIPWRDEFGNLVTINARDVTGQVNNKYIFKKNSSKKDILYNLDKIEQDFSKPIILCEGEKDVMRLWEYGYKRAVALGGSDLGKRKWLLKRYTNSVILALDCDEPGLKARKKITKELYPFMEIYAINLPENKDVADIKNKNRIDKIFKNKSKFERG